MKIESGISYEIVGADSIVDQLKTRFATSKGNAVTTPAVAPEE